VKVLSNTESVKTLTWVDRARWRKWLRANHTSQHEIWLVLPKKAGAGISYRDYFGEALDEAICYGWIDSRIRRMDEKRSMVRFTPRKSLSWSQLNFERAVALLKKGKVTRAGLKCLPEKLKTR
jgi:uncharacterized protein YdeI (YjbR/CyaY-like superfamily)